MGLLINGEWVDKWYDTESTGGKFKREKSKFRSWVRKDGSTEFSPEQGRYHLYVSLACPWAHRTLIFRKLKKLENIIDISIVDPLMLENGWEFSKYPGSIPDSVNGCDYLYQLYLKADENFTGRVTVPLLWDKKHATVVNNESSEIIRMFNSEFSDFTRVNTDYYPDRIRSGIDEINHFVYSNVNNGVYKCGFATSQDAYSEAFDSLFNSLDRIENILSENTYLCGDKITEADWRLFTTLIRFDPVYHGHFKCNKKQIKDYTHIYPYLKKLYNHPGIKETVNFRHIKEHYYKSHTTINPTGIVPKGPDLELL